MIQRAEISTWDIIGLIADVQTSFTENYKKLETNYKWQNTDARLQIMFNCNELAANSRLSVAMLIFSQSKGMISKEWWQNWAAYSELAFNNCPDFNVFVFDKSRQYIHRIQEQLIFTS